MKILSKEKGCKIKIIKLLKRMEKQQYDANLYNI
jgi:hypothetical protein